MEEIERSINELKERVAKIEASQAARDVTLQNIEQKIDHLTDMSERNDLRYQNKEHCEQLSVFQAREIEMMDKRLHITETEFKAHEKDAYSAKDRMLDWLWKGIFSAVVLAKLGNLI